MTEINLMDRYPQSPRQIKERAEQITDEHIRVAKQFGKEFFDGDRLYGYGGYHYHPRFWQPTVQRFRDHYGLAEDASVLDVGCAKGFMLHDFAEQMPDLTVAGIDISEYAISNAIESIKPFVKVGNARELPYDNDSFDLVICINTIHNLHLEDCKQAIREIDRVSRKDSFIMVDAWHNDEELERMRQWNLTAETTMHVDDWRKLFSGVGYAGDYYWFIATP